MRVLIVDTLEPHLSHYRRLDELELWAFKNMHRARRSYFLDEFGQRLDVNVDTPKSIFESVKLHERV